MSENTISKSQAKRKARQEEIKRNKRIDKRDRIIGTVVVVILLAIAAALVGNFVYNRIIQTTSSDDFSAFLNEDGTIKNVEPLDHINPIDYKNLVVDQASVTFSEEAIDAEIDTLLASHKTLSEDPALTVADSDTVHIDYVGKVDGVPFEGGDTQGNGADLTIGSGQYVEGFEEQLIGAHPGDQVSVTVTLPEDYSSEELQGKEAVFDVTVNGIYTTPEFDDAFVAEHLAETASTVEEYRAKIKEERERTNLLTAVQTVFESSATANSYNEEYLDYLRGILKYQDEMAFQSMNEMYLSLTGAYYANSFEDYTGMSITDYEKSLTARCELQSTAALAYQYVFTDAGLSVTEEDYNNIAAELGADAEEIYGKPFIMQLVMRDRVLNYLADHAKVE